MCVRHQLKSETYVSFVCPADDDEEEEQGSDSEERRQEDDEEAYTMNAVVDRATVSPFDSSAHATSNGGHRATDS